MIDDQSDMLDAVRQLATQVLGSSDLPTVERVDHGVSTRVYRVIRDQEVFYVRVLPETGASFAPEAYAHRILRNNGIRVPDAIYYEDYHEPLQRSVMITTEVHGYSIAEAGMTPNTPQILREAGRDLARINSVSVSGSGWIRRDPGAANRLVAEHATFLDFLYDPSDSFTEHLLLLEQYVFSPREVTAIRKIVEQSLWLFGANTSMLAHGDLDTTHIYQRNGQYAGIIDFGEIRGADQLYDLAHFRVHDGEQITASLLPWLLEGYRDIVELPSSIDERLALLSLLNAVRALARDLRQRSFTESIYQRFLIRGIIRDTQYLQHEALTRIGARCTTSVVHRPGDPISSGSRGGFVADVLPDTPTPHPDVNHVLRLLRAHLRHVLGEKLVALWIGGSLVSGGFDRDASDIDLTAALTVDIDDVEFDALRRMHTEVAARHPEWDDRIEVCYVPVGALRNVRADRRMIVNISPGEPFHWTPLRDEWLVTWYDLRQHSVALYGPDAATLIEPISQDEFVSSLVSHARSWGQWIHDMRRRQQQAYAILSMCRLLYAVHHGHQASKQGAAQWVASRFPEWTELISNALVWRITPEGHDTDHEATFPETERFINSIRMEILERHG